MKNIIVASLFILIITDVTAQGKSDDYNVLNKLIRHLEEFEEKPINVLPNSVSFTKANEVFTKDVWTEMTYSPGDSGKIKLLKDILDFGFLANKERLSEPLDFSLLKNSVVKYSHAPNTFDQMTKFGLSMPIYSKDGKYAFVYYYEICGYPDCGGSYMLNIFEKTGKKWCFYHNISVWPL